MGAFTPLLLLAAAAVLCVVLGRRWRRHALDGVHYEAEVSPRRTFPGEAVNVAFRAANAKRVPVPWLRTVDVIASTLRVHDARVSPHHLPRMKELHQTWSLGAWEEVRRVYRARVLERGRVEIGPAELVAANPFGTGEARGVREGRASVIVYPRPFPLPGRPSRADDPAGRRERQSWLVADPLRIVGIRPYEPGDPQRLVHWPATARTGALQVRRIATAVAEATAVFLEVRTAGDPWQGVDRARHEAAVSVAATLCRRLAAHGGSFSLHCNGSVRNGPRHLELGAGAGARHLQAAMEGLAVVSPYATVSMAALVRHRRRRLPPAAGIVVVAPHVGPALALQLREAARTREVRLVLVGDEPVPAMPGVSLSRIPQEAVDRWTAEAPGGDAATGDAARADAAAGSRRETGP